MLISDWLDLFYSFDFHTEVPEGYNNSFLAYHDLYFVVGTFKNGICDVVSFNTDYENRVIEYLHECSNDDLGGFCKVNDKLIGMQYGPLTGEFTELQDVESALETELGERNVKYGVTRNVAIANNVDWNDLEGLKKLSFEILGEKNIDPNFMPLPE